MGFRSTKTYGHELGLSCAFRQWRADSHCRFLHGYALSVRLEFAATTLDERNWVMDFGGLKPVKDMIVQKFDHKTIIALDDPEKLRFIELGLAGVIQLEWLSDVGCEAFARWIGLGAQQWLNDHPRNAHFKRNVWLHSCEVREHGANSAIWIQEF